MKDQLVGNITNEWIYLFIFFKSSHIGAIIEFIYQHDIIKFFVNNVNYDSDANNDILEYLLYDFSNVFVLNDICV